MIRKITMLILVLLSIKMVAQRNNASPYSKFGMGDDISLKTVEQTSMGGIGVAMKSLNYLNFVNPAAYADVRYATYAFGGKTTFLTLKDKKGSQSGNYTSLSYVGLAFPITKKSAFSAGLQPLTSVGYSLLDDEKGVKVERQLGKGGANRLYASYGIYLFKGFSVGVEGAFVFGNVEKNILSQDYGVTLGTKHNEHIKIRGGEFKFGAQYKIDLKNKLELNSGVAIRVSTKLREYVTSSISSVVFDKSGADTFVESLLTETISRTSELPLKTTVGLGLGKQHKWYFALNSEFKNAVSVPNQNKYKYDKGFKMSVGGFYIPKINSISSYWNRVTYRAGFRYEDTGLLVNKNNKFTPIKDFGINVGLGLPLQMSSINLGFEYGQKGTIDNNLIKEEYFNVRLSLSLNSSNWFKQRKID